LHTLVPPGVRFKQCAAQAQPAAEALCSVCGESSFLTHDISPMGAAAAARSGRTHAGRCPAGVQPTAFV
jgi:hypothetical protein